MRTLRTLTHRIFHDEENRLIWMTSPLIFMHLACIGVFWTGVSWPAIVALGLTYSARVFALTAGFHRYFSHRSFKTSRVFQFVLAWTGTSAAQLGPLWWAGNHRHHHQHSDTEQDIHSPKIQGIFWAHIGWVLCKSYNTIQKSRIRDFYQYVELRLLERFHILAPISLACFLYTVGMGLNHYWPHLGTSGWQMVMWGFFVSTALVYHVTFCVNSLTHVVGKKRFAIADESRNSLWVALLTFGEGWHNNHHRYPASARQGMYWWEIDITYMLLRVLEKLGLIWDLKGYPPRIYKEATQAAVPPTQ